VPSENERILSMMQLYLTAFPDAIHSQDVCELTAAGIPQEDAYAYLMAAYLGLESDGKDKGIFLRYFPHMIRRQAAEAYRRNPYYQTIRLPKKKCGNCWTDTLSYAPFEAFVFDDFNYMKDGRVIPQIGYFDSSFSYPAIGEGKRIWMSVTPNEVNTMSAPVDAAYGNVLTYGLGLGYYAFMVSLRECVQSVTVVEKNRDVINIFKSEILSQFPFPGKIRIIEEDAFAFANASWKKGAYDVVFADLWHDAGDGMPMYLKLKELERKRPECQYEYWIEKTIKAYL